MPENIDLRGTQGAVVLPGGTVTQHYPASESAVISHSATQHEHAQHEHSIDIALLKDRVSTNSSEIRELWNAIAHIREALRPKTVDFSTLILVIMAIISISITIIYVGGNWGR